MKIAETIKTLCSFPLSIFYINRLNRKLDDLMILQGRMLAQANQLRTFDIIQNIQQAEFKVFSQWGDDGIIQFLIHYLDITEHTFIEFGVENYKEANTRFLLINNNWKGLVMDGSDKHMRELRHEKIYWRHDLTAVTAFITKENINELIRTNGFAGELGILHVDIDGNDYWVWKEIDTVNPAIVIMEYNSVFGVDKPWTVPYNPAFFRTNYHYSNLCFGSSLLSLCDLAEEKGYDFIGCTSSGNNAYFVRKDKMKGLKKLTPQEGFVSAMSRESRDQAGNLTYVSGADRLALIKGMKVINTRTGQEEII